MKIFRAIMDVMEYWENAVKARHAMEDSQDALFGRNYGEAARYNNSAYKLVTKNLQIAERRGWRTRDEGFTLKRLSRRAGRIASHLENITGEN